MNTGKVDVLLGLSGATKVKERLSTFLRRGTM